MICCLFAKKKRKSGFIAVIVIIIAVMMCGCDSLKGKLKIAAGNFYYSQGVYNKAVGAYLDAIDYPATAAYANYALGSAYLSLEQPEAALERFARAEDSFPDIPVNHDLLYRIRYNSGIAQFQRGEYKEAALCFRRALEVDNSMRNAKRNLELCLIYLNMNQQISDINNNQTRTVLSNEKNDRNEIIFDYIRQKETDKWKSWEWIGEEDTGPDY
ncbi:MAG: tetratricopeptide repeat protein [Spirochaetaceae bacterium]|jgi:Ca-activated chloride channel family protein|nr:tetratricopeptide repeat protein [Spirochaetaceae bacterium]